VKIIRQNLDILRVTVPLMSCSPRVEGSLIQHKPNLERLETRLKDINSDAWHTKNRHNSKLSQMSAWPFAEKEKSNDKSKSITGKIEE